MRSPTSSDGFAGENQASRDLVERYQPVIRREVRESLRDSRLRRLFEWTDISQLVMGSFFAGAAAGRYDLEKPDNLIRLLVNMTRRNLAKQVRRNRAARRDYRRLQLCDLASLDGRPAETPDPCQLTCGRELLEAYRSRLSEEERGLADLRSEGWGWAEIAAKLGGTPQARRKQLARAIVRVADEIADRDESGLR